MSSQTKTIFILMDLLSVATSALTAAREIGALMETARLQGRDISLDELKALAVDDDEARERLLEAIERFE